MLLGCYESLQVDILNYPQTLTDFTVLCYRENNGPSVELDSKNLVVVSRTRMERREGQARNTIRCTVMVDAVRIHNRHLGSFCHRFTYS